MAKHRNIRKNPHRSNATDRRKSLARAAKTAEKATHEVAKTNASDPHPSSFPGQYEPCSIVSDDGSTYTVKIQDGNGVAKLSDRMQSWCCIVSFVGSIRSFVAVTADGEALQSAMCQQCSSGYK